MEEKSFVDVILALLIVRSILSFRILKISKGFSGEKESSNDDLKHLLKMTEDLTIKVVKN